MKRQLAAPSFSSVTNKELLAEHSGILREGQPICADRTNRGGPSRQAPWHHCARLRDGRIARAIELDALRRPLRHANDSLTRGRACNVSASNSLEAEVRLDPELAVGKDEEER